MRKYILIAFLGILTASCNTQDDPFENDNKAPEILVKKATSNEFQAEFVDSLKIENETYSFEYKINDEESDLIGVFACDNEESILESEGNLISLTASKLGENTVTITTVDGFGVQSSTSVKIVAFENLPPVADFEVKTNETLLSKYERRIDASLSFDKDEKFGGKIVEWEFRVNNQAFVRKTESYRDYIFPQAGSYNVQVRVKDSNGVWSEIESKNIKIS